MKRATALLLLCLAGCVSGPATRLYMLAPAPGSVVEHPSRTIVVREVNLPHYLDRPQIVTRSGHRLLVNESAQWGGDLRESLTRLLAENLGMRLPGSTVLPAPTFSHVSPDLRVEVDILRFEAAGDGRVHLAARWRAGNENRPGTVHTRAWSRPWAGDGVDGALVGAMSELLGDLAQAIAADLAMGRP